MNYYCRGTIIVKLFYKAFNLPMSAVFFILKCIYVFEKSPFFFSASGFPKVGAGPSFGKIVGPAQKGPDLPTPQPHPEDLNSLVQRAEHIPAGTRTPMCCKCNKVIRYIKRIVQAPVTLKPKFCLSSSV